MTRRFRSAAGFTLLEVMVSLAILAVSLVSILNLHSGAVRMHNYSKHLTVATLLARSKLVDVEEYLYAEELKDFDDALDGDFRDEGYPTFKWKAEIVKPKLALDTSQIGGLIGQAMGMDPEELGGDTEGGLLGSMGGGIEAMVAGQVEQLTTLIEESVREVRLTVAWKDITGDSSLTVVTHIVRLEGQNAPGSEAERSRLDAAKQLRSQVGNLPNIPGRPSPNINAAVNPTLPNVRALSQGLRQLGRPANE